MSNDRTARNPGSLRPQGKERDMIKNLRVRNAEERAPMSIVAMAEGK
jgi:hypothetical protein